MESSQEQRQSLRYGASLELVIQELSSPGAPDPPAAPIRGKTRNISNGGLCVLLDQVSNASSLLKCEIFVPGCPVAIPTLARVRWIQNGHREFIAGLEFLLR